MEVSGFSRNFSLSFARETGVALRTDGLEAVEEETLPFSHLFPVQKVIPVLNLIISLLQWLEQWRADILGNFGISNILVKLQNL